MDVNIRKADCDGFPQFMAGQVAMMLVEDTDQTASSSRENDQTVRLPGVQLLTICSLRLYMSRFVESLKLEVGT